MRLKLTNIFAVLLMIGLVLPVCSKAFADVAPSDDGVAAQLARAVGGKVVSSSGNEPAADNVFVPCLKCCGGWEAIAHHTITPLPKPSEKVAFLTNHNSYLALSPPYEVSGINQRAPPHIRPPYRGYDIIHARTGRLLL